MRLYRLLAQNWQALFGSPEAPTTKDDIILIGQAPDCSEWLVLSANPDDALTSFDGDYSRYDFIYRQEWGLTINQEVVQRAWADTRAKAYPIPFDYVDGIVKGDINQQEEYIQACLAVKAKYPKIIWD